MDGICRTQGDEKCLNNFDWDNRRKE